MTGFFISILVPLDSILLLCVAFNMTVTIVSWYIVKVIKSQLDQPVKVNLRYYDPNQQVRYVKNRMYQ